MAERRHGAILNVSSFAAIAPIPRYAVYSGAKAYVIAFSQALRHEPAVRPRRAENVQHDFPVTPSADDDHVHIT